MSLLCRYRSMPWLRYSGIWRPEHIVFFQFFFFSSRRRHTRLQGDWSSDVCSSDLPQLRLELSLASALMIPARHDWKRYDMSVFVPVTVGFSTSKWLARIGVRAQAVVMPNNVIDRSEKGRVGKEGRSRGWPDHLKKKKKYEMGVGKLTESIKKGYDTKKKKYKE